MSTTDQKWTFPLRVRCVDAQHQSRMRTLELGDDCLAVREAGPYFVLENNVAWLKSRFKPVVRVKAKCVRARVLL